MTRCPPPDVLMAQPAGVLPPEVNARVEAHLRSCAVCQVLLRDLQDPGLEPAAAESQDRVWRRITAEARPRCKWLSWPVLLPAVALAASLVIAVAVGIQWTAHTPVPSPPVAQVKPLNLPLDRAAVNLPLSDSILWRDAAPPPRSPLAQALDPYSKGDYQTAEQQLARVGSPEAGFYRAVSLLFLHRASEAIPLLEGNKTAGSDWYLAIAYDRAGQRDRAIAVLKEICARPGPHRDRACAAL
ncbi:MAG: hypothetical protein FJW39_22110 [Acidobacteria bacterium]|nr:hypothetical protein [Acidobacteriota bacterium]